MKRAGCLLLAIVPVVVTAGAYFFTPAQPGGEGLGSSAASAGTQGRQESKAAAESDEDAELVDALPPGLAAPAKKELAQRIVASAVNSTTRWRETYGSIRDTGDGRGYTAGILGFCTGTHDLLALVERYTEDHPGNGLARYLPALRAVDGTDSHEGLDPGFTEAWRAEAEVEAFQAAQEAERDRAYFDPAVRLAKLDGLGDLGQLVYYDAMVLHGPGTEKNGFYELRERVMADADTPAEGGSEEEYLDAFLDVHRAAVVERERGGDDTGRVDTTLRRFLDDGNLGLSTPLEWRIGGRTYRAA
ncbi:chitosanase [Streptomyces sp. UH6]|uniref:chitosanase n=1 Tax=Streptomyces sp. UH6 TaxID=2748379 RepID=UPI0015D4B536|nr:chitosanase [Streptomyces sp. UH6]NYV75215.1 chitosanase [Streptomyces sp. UH6]